MGGWALTSACLCIPTMQSQHSPPDACARAFFCRPLCRQPLLALPAGADATLPTPGLAGWLSEVGGAAAAPPFQLPLLPLPCLAHSYLHTATNPIFPDAQQEALAFMCQRETSNGLPPFWEPRLAQAGGDLSYVSSLTNFIAHQRPGPLRGGILADDMGLGKTLEVQQSRLLRGAKQWGRHAGGMVPCMGPAAYL